MPVTLCQTGVVLQFLRSLFHPPPVQSLPEASWLIVGLGNPGPKYETSRHNVGFLALDKCGASFSGYPPAKAEVGSWNNALLVKPQTFMNLSGESVARLTRELGIDPSRVIVIHDELDLPAGTVRLKLGGNENGHNGLKSISEHLGTRDYIRVRIGISRPPAGVRVPDYVLGPVGDLSTALSDAADGARLIIEVGLQKAQNEIHSRGK